MVSPEHAIADTDTRRRAQVRKQALEHAVGKGAQVKAWVMVNGTGEAQHGGALFVVACDLCPVARSGYDTGELTAWWREHYPTHAVEVSTDGQRHQPDLPGTRGGDGHATQVDERNP